MGDVHELPPRGHYLAQEVGLLAGVSGERIGQWARRGYIRASQSMGRPHVYSYQDVAEAMVVHELEDVGADLRSIKRAIQRLREQHGLSWPLQRHKGQLDAVHGSVVKYEDGVASGPSRRATPSATPKRTRGARQRGPNVIVRRARFPRHTGQATTGPGGVPTRKQVRLRG